METKLESVKTRKKQSKRLSDAKEHLMAGSCE
jgi:hypothetical protein